MFNRKSSSFFRKAAVKSGLCSCLLLFLMLFITGCKKDPEIVTPPAPEEDNREAYSGGDATVFDESINAFGHSIPGISAGDEGRFVTGNSFFRDNWVMAPSSTTARDGLGPVFNSNSCSGCHFKDGRGKPPVAPSEKLSSMLIRLSIQGTDEHGGPLGHPVYGGQFNGSSILKVLPEGDVTVNYQEIIDYFSDGGKYTLSQPVYSFNNLNYGPLSGILFSPRVAQQMPGLGLLEAVEEATILSFADPGDADGDGISGRPNYVWDYVNNKTSMGRFGWKANQPSLRQQTAGAFLGDIGITSGLFPDENLSAEQKKLYPDLKNGGTPEISDELLDNVVYYTTALAVPGRRNVKDAEVIRGKQLFLEANCSGCHKPEMKTGSHPMIAQLSGQLIHPYTDLLLHDMGPGLADDRPDYLAGGTEWRTPPLWGIGLVKVVNNHTFFLHDGRARSLEEAVLWHGGEAEKSKNYYRSLSKADRAALIKFLESL
jgi:CxxC motif-containing protein (DUF1111 family)